MRTLAVDVDDTLLNHVPLWLKVFTEKTGHCVELDHVTDWAFSCVPEQLRPVLYACRTPALYVQMRPLPGAVAAVRSLAQRYRLVAVTHDEPHFVPAKRAALARWFPELRNIVIVKDKHSVQADALIDDGLHNAPTFVFERPWNVSTKALRWTWPMLQAVLEEDHLASPYFPSVVLRAA